MPSNSQTRLRFAKSPVTPARGGAGDVDRLVSAVIVNFNAGDFLTVAVQSLLASDVSPVEIIVVDNASTDDSISRLQATIDDARLIVLHAGRNLGFAGACNVGIQASRGAAILLLNPDCRIYPGTLAALIEELDADPSIGMVGPLIVNPDGSEQRGCRRDVPNPWQIFCVAFGLHRLMPRHPRFRTFNLAAEPMPCGPVAVPAISGACMLVARETIERIGYLDDSYFLHFEDIDWCMRLGAVEGRIVFVPGAVVVHTQGVCSRTRPIRVEYHKHRSLIRFLRQNFTGYYPSSFMAVVSVVVMLRLGPSILRALLHRRGDPAGAWSRIFAEPADDRSAPVRGGPPPTANPVRPR
jgi:GT2 family glycosyltransferase